MARQHLGNLISQFKILLFGRKCQRLFGKGDAGADGLRARGDYFGTRRGGSERRVVEAELFGVSGFDAPTVAAAAGVLACVTIAAAILPASRAASSPSAPDGRHTTVHRCVPPRQHPDSGRWPLHHSQTHYTDRLVFGLLWACHRTINAAINSLVSL